MGLPQTFLIKAFWNILAKLLFCNCVCKITASWELEMKKNVVIMLRRAEGFFVVFFCLFFFFSPICLNNVWNFRWKIKQNKNLIFTY